MIRQRVRELQAKTRRELFGNTAAALLVVAISGFGIARTNSAAARLAFACSILWILAGQYFLHRGMWSATPPGDAALSTGLESYRHQLEQRRNLSRRVLQWSFAPLLVSISGLIFTLVGFAESRGLSLRSIAPFCTLFVIWLIAFSFKASQDRKNLREEIEELDQIGSSRS